MTEIDKVYDRIDKEVTESYRIKRENLKKEEENLKDELKNKVTKIKEQLEIAISEVNSLLRISDKIVKGIKSLVKEEKIMIKTLSYVSQINNSKKEMRKLFSIIL